MNRHPLGKHLPSCTPANCAEYRKLLTMSAAEYSAWLKAQDVNIRTASRRGSLRALNYTPPDAYAPGIARMREVDPCPCVRFCGQVSPDFDPRYNAASGVPPDPYGIGLALAQVAANGKSPNNEKRRAAEADMRDTENLGAYAAGVRALRKENHG